MGYAADVDPGATGVEVVEKMAPGLFRERRSVRAQQDIEVEWRQLGELRHSQRLHREPFECGVEGGEVERVASVVGNPGYQRTATRGSSGAGGEF